MARPQSRILLWGQYLAARLVAMGLTTFDAQTSLRAAAVFGRQLYRFDRRHRERTVANLKRSFPELNSIRIDRLACRSFEHLVQLAVEVCQTPRLLHADSWPQHTRLKNVDQTVELLNSGKPVLLITGHVGNWEAMGYLLAVWGYSIDAIARPIDNPLINDWLLDIRQRRGLRIITKWNATEQMLSVLQSGGSLGFIADQNAGEKGLFVPFFGRLASTYKSIGLLALTQNIPIVCGYACRLPPGLKYEIGTTDIIRPEDWSDQPDPLYYITARYIRAIETAIRIFPDQYLWMHRRWKTRPAYERLGKPMPVALRRKLESLPWMCENELQQLACPRLNG